MQWIDCMKQMPAKHEEVLVWVKYQSGNEEFTESWIDDDGWAMGSAKNFIVSHWMRIEPPNVPHEGRPAA